MGRDEGREGGGGRHFRVKWVRLSKWRGNESARGRFPAQRAYPRSVPPQHVTVPCLGPASSQFGSSVSLSSPLFLPRSLRTTGGLNFAELSRLRGWKLLATVGYQGERLVRDNSPAGSWMCPTRSDTRLPHPTANVFPLKRSAEERGASVNDGCRQSPQRPSRPIIRCQRTQTIRRPLRCHASWHALCVPCL